MLAAEMGFSMKVCFTPACAGEVPGHSCPPPQRVFHELCAFSFSSWPLFAMCSKAGPAQRFPWLRPPDHRQNRLFSKFVFLRNSKCSPNSQTLPEANLSILLHQRSAQPEAAHDSAGLACRLLTVERRLMGQRGEIIHPRVRGSAGNQQRWFTGLWAHRVLRHHRGGLGWGKWSQLQ